MSLLEAAVETDCGHAFCGVCLFSCLERHTGCPVCRKTVQSIHPSWALRQLAARARQSIQQQECPTTTTTTSTATPADPATSTKTATTPEASIGDVTQIDAKIAAFNRPKTWIERETSSIYSFLVAPTPQGKVASILAWCVVFGVAVYVISPLDVLPEGLGAGVFGLFDDLLAILYLVYVLRILARSQQPHQTPPTQHPHPPSPPSQQQ
eukprot:TRINITY_DN10370_c0_g1_i2.p1 TRINITY_DN10370_c0_g1~~TRINITY_DN10370_c0_g1_i2.p1  ORF type:complete len:209 (-),score=32.39 TRINITY_DN10370_c0_g1_i2:28-654(-)